MISTPRMNCYEKFMRQAEFSSFRQIVQGLNEIQSRYDWNLHKRDGNSFKIELMGSYEKILVDTRFLPKAFTENEIVRVLLQGLAHFNAKSYSENIVHIMKEHNLNADCDEIKQIKDEMIIATTNYVNKWSRLLYHFHMYRQEMNNTVLISRDLLMALSNTDFPTTTDYLKSPFRSFYLMFEPGCIITSSHTKMGAGYIPSKTFDETYDYEGAFVNLDTIDNGDTILRINMVVRQTKKNKEFIHNLDPVNTYWELVIPKGNDMMIGILEAIETMKKQDKRIDHVEEGVMAHFSNTVVQVLLYMTSVNRDSVLVKTEKKQIDKNRAKKYLEREETQMDYNVLGTRTNFIGGSVNKNGNSSNKKGNGKKLMFKTTVRGHWHSFWYKDEAKIAAIPVYMHREEKYDDMGKKMIRCIKWVAPYHKGEGEMVNKEYKLTTGGQKLKKGA